MTLEELRSALRDAATGGFAESSVRREAERCLASAERSDLAVDLLLCDGPVEVAEVHTAREPWIGLLIVRGDLTVRGLYADSLDPTSTVIVTGDLRCERLLSEGLLEVHGSVVVEHEALWMDNDGCAEIGGDLRAGFLYSLYHGVKVHGRVETPLGIGDDPRRIEAGAAPVFRLLDDTDEENKETLRARLIPEALVIEGDPDEPDGEWWIDEVRPMVLRAHVLDGKRLLRAPA